MINNTIILHALRTQAKTLSVATTGSTTLEATATGYARLAGSFIDDGFMVGMEVLPVGFTDNSPCVIDNVDASTLTIRNGRTVEASTSGRTLSVGLPALRAWENIKFDPNINLWFVEEHYIPGPASQITIGPLGEIEADPMYMLKLYGLANMGAEALYALADGLLNLFPPRLPLTLSTGDVLRVRQNPAPYRSQLLQAEPGWCVVPVTIPCRIRTVNSI